MRKVEVGPGKGLDRLRLASLSSREPGAGEIAVKVEASSLNYADYVFCTDIAATRYDLFSLDPGRVPLVDGAGVVTAVGRGVEEFRVGDKVVGVFHYDWSEGDRPAGLATKYAGIVVDGFAAEQVVRPATNFTHAPKGWTPAEAATLGCAGVTAWRAFQNGPGVKPGDWVLVQGTGGVSIFALLFAKSFGARVIATTSSEEKLHRLQEIGADGVINYKETPQWGDRAREIAGADGLDHVVDLGGPQTLAQSFRATRNRGVIYSIGLLGGTVYSLPLAELMDKEVRLQGVGVGSRADQVALIQHLEDHRLRPVVDRSFDLADLAAAFRYQEAQKQIGKIVIDI